MKSSCRATFPIHLQIPRLSHLPHCCRLYLYTEAESSAAMYARYGWVEQERIDYYGHEAILMYLDTTQAPADSVTV